MWESDPLLRFMFISLPPLKTPLSVCLSSKQRLWASAGRVCERARARMCVIVYLLPLLKPPSVHVLLNTYLHALRDVRHIGPPHFAGSSAIATENVGVQGTKRVFCEATGQLLDRITSWGFRLIKKKKKKL